MDKKIEFRCTRNRSYVNPRCAGHADPEVREGHYVFAQTPLGAAIEMFSTWPDEAFLGFTIMEKENPNMMWTWTMGEGLRKIREGKWPSGVLEVMFLDADSGLEDETVERVQGQLARIESKRPRYHLGGPIWRIVEKDIKITVSLHHHRHGVDTYLHKSKRRGLTLDEVIEIIGENYEEDREGEYVENVCVVTQDEIKEVQL